MWVYNMIVLEDFQKRKAEELKRQFQRKMVPSRGHHISKAAGLSGSTAHVGNNQKASDSRAESEQ